MDADTACRRRRCPNVLVGLRRASLICVFDDYSQNSSSSVLPSARQMAMHNLIVGL
jgi:hypothetical protein